MTRRPRRLAAALAVALLVAACTDDGDAEPEPRPEGSTSSTEAIDRSGIALRGVEGATTSTIPTDGSAVLAGTVAGPGGLIPGATVRIERLHGDSVQRTDVPTGPDGRFSLADVPGGRYRLRAFLPPMLAQEEAVVEFLADGTEHTFELTVTDERGLVARAAVAPSPPVPGRAANLAVLLVSRVVDVDGIVRSRPVIGVELQLLGLGRLILLTEDDATSTTAFDVGGADPADAGARTDGAGVARWALECVDAGPVNLSIEVPIAPPPPVSPATSAPDPAAPTTGPTTTVAGPASQVLPLELPACSAPAAPTTTTTTAAAGATTTTSP